MKSQEATIPNNQLVQILTSSQRIEILTIGNNGRTVSLSRSPSFDGDDQFLLLDDFGSLTKEAVYLTAQREGFGALLKYVLTFSECINEPNEYYGINYYELQRITSRYAIFAEKPIKFINDGIVQTTIKFEFPDGHMFLGFYRGEQVVPLNDDNICLTKIKIDY